MKSATDIFQNIVISAKTGCVLKIKLKNVTNPIITAVEKIGKKTIFLKPTCLYGYKLPKRRIMLPEIENVVRYKTQFDHPVFSKLRYIKDNIAEIRRNIAALNVWRKEAGAL